MLFRSSGLLDRFPALQFVSVESGLGWVPFMVEALEYQYRENNTRVPLELTPAEYFRRNFAEARFTPRPKLRNRVRKYTYLGSMDYVTDAKVTVLQNKELRGLFQTEFQNSDNYTLEYLGDYEWLAKPFTISPGVVVPAGGYHYRNLRTSYSLGDVEHLYCGACGWHEPPGFTSDSVIGAPVPARGPAPPTAGPRRR